MRISFFLVLLSSLFCGCANFDNYDSDDPLESFNRPVEAANTSIDKVIFTPLCDLYRYYLPSQLRHGIHRMFLNLGEISNSVNAMLQGDWHGVENSLGRFSINSTFGLLGFFDKAQEVGFEKKYYDFGQTLYSWGYKKSTFIMIPLLGPATIRDSFAIIVDGFLLNPTMYISPTADKNLVSATQFIDLKANIHERYSNVEPPEYFDRYIIFKDAYLQSREHYLNPPEWESMYDLDF